MTTACQKSFTIPVPVVAGLCEESDQAVRIKDYGSLPAWTLAPDLMVSGSAAWQGQFPRYGANSFGHAGCTYFWSIIVNGPMPSIQGKLTNYLICSSGYGGWPDHWVLLICCARNTDPLNAWVWCGTKPIAEGDDPTGVYTRNPALYGGGSDNRATVELEQYTL